MVLSWFPWIDHSFVDAQIDSWTCSALPFLANTSLASFPNSSWLAQVRPMARQRKPRVSPRAIQRPRRRTRGKASRLDLDCVAAVFCVVFVVRSRLALGMSVSRALRIIVQNFTFSCCMEGPRCLPDHLILDTDSKELYLGIGLEKLEQLFSMSFTTCNAEVCKHLSGNAIRWHQFNGDWRKGLSQQKVLWGARWRVFTRAADVVAQRIPQLRLRIISIFRLHHSIDSFEYSLPWREPSTCTPSPPPNWFMIWPPLKMTSESESHQGPMSNQ